MRAFVRMLVLTLSTIAFLGTVAVADPSAPLAFGPSVTVDSTVSAFEPGLWVAPDDTLYVTAPTGFPTGVTHVWRSTSGGGFVARDPPPFAVGGGDSDVLLAPDGTLYAADLWLGSISVWASTDGGLTWSGPNPVGSGTVANDRMWLAADAGGAVYLLYNQLETGYWVAKSTDHGATFVPIPAGPAAMYPPGPLVATPSGALAFIHSAPIPFALAGALGGVGAGPVYAGFAVYVATSTDGGLFWTDHLVAELPEWGQNLFPSLAADAAGNLYAVWSEGIVTDFRQIRYSVSTDLGAHWSSPVTVSSGAGSFELPWASAGAAGHLGIAFLHSPTGHSDANADWYVKYAVTTNALAAAPTFQTALVTPTRSTHGAFLLGARPDIGDFLTLRHLSDGSAVVAWAEQAPGGPFAKVAKQADGPLL